jgi:hypothetical protein
MAAADSTVVAEVTAAVTANRGRKLVESERLAA